MDKQQTKTVYQPPKIVTVAFNVEIGISLILSMYSIMVVL